MGINYSKNSKSNEQQQFLARTADGRAYMRQPDGSVKMIQLPPEQVKAEVPKPAFAAQTRKSTPDPASIVDRVKANAKPAPADPQEQIDRILAGNRKPAQKSGSTVRANPFARPATPTNPAAPTKIAAPATLAVVKPAVAKPVVTQSVAARAVKPGSPFTSSPVSQPLVKSSAKTGSPLKTSRMISIGKPDPEHQSGDQAGKAANKLIAIPEHIRKAGNPLWTLNAMLNAIDRGRDNGYPGHYDEVQDYELPDQAGSLETDGSENDMPPPLPDYLYDPAYDVFASRPELSDVPILPSEYDELDHGALPLSTATQAPVQTHGQGQGQGQRQGQGSLIGTALPSGPTQQQAIGMLHDTQRRHLPRQPQQYGQDFPVFEPFRVPCDYELIFDDVNLDPMGLHLGDRVAPSEADERQDRQTLRDFSIASLYAGFPGKLGWSDPAMTLLLPPAHVRNTPPTRDRKLDDENRWTVIEDATMLMDMQQEDRDAPHPMGMFRMRFTGIAIGFELVHDGRRMRENCLWRIRANHLTTLEAPLAKIEWPLKKRTRMHHLVFADCNNRMVRVSVFGPGTNSKHLRAGEMYSFRGEVRHYDYPSISTSRVFHCGKSLSWLQPFYPTYPRVANHDAISFAVSLYMDGWTDQHVVEREMRAVTTYIAGECEMVEEDLIDVAQADLHLTTRNIVNGEVSLGKQKTMPVDDVPCSLMEMFQAIHRPRSHRQHAVAMRMAGKMNAIAIQSKAIRHHKRPAQKDAPIPVEVSDLEPLFDIYEAKTGYRLTQSQKDVSRQIVTALKRPEPLAGLLSGDVGTGKTTPIMLVAMAAHKAGRKVAIMTPRTLLSQQLERELTRVFGEHCQIERVATGKKIKDTGAILISTPGLGTTAKKQGWEADLLIIDEQHKMATKDRERMIHPHTHLLELSATPIPRSLAASIYGGMSIFNLRECPVEKIIHSEIIDMSQEEERVTIIRRLRDAMSRGERCAIVYPRVIHKPADPEDEEEGGKAAPKLTRKQIDALEEQKEQEVKASVEQAFVSFEKLFPGKCCMLHGKMKEEELQASIADLRSGKRPLVIASTIIEIGIDIPSVSVMAVREPEYFGISQLHQLRGRLVRNGGEGYFMMAATNASLLADESIDRLECMVKSNDGYELAEMDLANRGFGDLDGDAQTGDSNMIFRGKLNPRDCLSREATEILAATRGERGDFNVTTLRQLRSAG